MTKFILAVLEEDPRLADEMGWMEKSVFYLMVGCWFAVLSIVASPLLLLFP